MTGMPLAPQFIGNNPVQDKTGLEGKWEFTFKYTLPGRRRRDAITLQDALDKQLGLKLEQQTMSLPVIVVEKASRPSPNEPDVAKKIPASPTEFEVATIKPFAPSHSRRWPPHSDRNPDAARRPRRDLRPDAETT